MPYQNAIDLLASEFPKSGIHCLLIGGFALTCYGVTRLTADIDIVIIEQDYDQAKSVLEHHGYKTGVKKSNFVRCYSGSGALMDIDILFVTRQTFDRLLASSKNEPVLGRPMSIPSLDHLIAMKLHAIKNNPKHRMFRDLPDIVNLFRQNATAISEKRLQELCRDYGPNDIYGKIRELTPEAVNRES